MSRCCSLGVACITGNGLIDFACTPVHISEGALEKATRQTRRFPTECMYISRKRAHCRRRRTRDASSCSNVPGSRIRFEERRPSSREDICFFLCQRDIWKTTYLPNGLLQGSVRRYFFTAKTRFCNVCFFHTGKVYIWTIEHR